MLSQEAMKRACRATIAISTMTPSIITRADQAGLSVAGIARDVLNARERDFAMIQPWTMTSPGIRDAFSARSVMDAMAQVR